MHLEIHLALAHSEKNNLSLMTVIIVYFLQFQYVCRY